MISFLSKWLSGLGAGGKLSRRAWLEILYTPKGGTESTDISEDITNYFLSLSYDDSIGGAVDDVRLTLEDRAGLWSAEWFPGSGARLELTIHVYNWESVDGGEETFFLGAFYVDEISLRGMPSTVEIKAVSINEESALRGEKKNRTWDEITLKKCAEDICADGGVSLFWDCADNPQLTHVEQTDESNLEFLSKIVRDAGFAMKVTPESVIIFDEASYEAKDPALLILHPGAALTEDTELSIISRLTDYGFTAKTRGVYQKCVVRYQKDKDKAVITGEFADPSKEDGGTLRVDEQVESVAEAETLAKKRLREANKEEITGSFATLGNFKLAAGVVVELSGYGVFDGKYIITRASHSLSESYTTSIDVRRCLDGY